MLLQHVLSFVHHALRIWLSGVFYFMGFEIAALSFLSLRKHCVPPARIQYWSGLYKISGYRILTRGKFMTFFLLMNIRRILIFSPIIWRLYIVHLDCRGLYVGHSLLSVLACCCAVHKSLIQLFHGIFFKPLPLLLFEKPYNLFFLFSVNSPGW